MNLTRQKNQQYTRKGLTFKNNTINLSDNSSSVKLNKICNSAAPTTEYLNTSVATIGYLQTQQLEAMSASLANILFTYNPNTNTTLIQNKQNSNLAIKTANGSDAINISPNGQIELGSDLTINGNFGAANICADNIDLLCGINAYSGCFSNSIDVQGAIRTNNIFGRSGDLQLRPLINYIVDIPNIKSRIDPVNTNLNPTLLKASKIFVNNSNFILTADPSCAGIEIIIYNSGTVNNITVSAPNVIATVAPLTAVHLVFINNVLGWAKL